MDLYVAASDAARDAMDRLATSCEQALAHHMIEADLSRGEDHLTVAVDEADAAEAVEAVRTVAGVAGATPIAAADRTTASIVDTIVTVIEACETDAVHLHGDAVTDEVRAAVAEQVDATLTDGREVLAEHHDDGVRVYEAPDNGVGGTPVDPDTVAVVHMADRAGTVAAAETVLDGVRVHPVYTGREPDRLEDDMRLLRGLDPAVKLTVMKGADPAEALDETAALYDADRVVLPDTADDEPAVNGLETRVERPLADWDEDAVLDRYAALMRPPEP